MFALTNRLRYLRLAVRNISRRVSSHNKNHYDSLGITPKATQGDVKAAYYKLSMVYHPDKNEGCQDAGQKFIDVAEAYEVLGNVRLRRLYDKGMHVGGGSTLREYKPDVDDPTTKFYKSREVRSRPPPVSGSTPIYDYDEWSRSHYGATFARDMKTKQRQSWMKQRKETDLNEIKTERVMVAMATMLFLFCYLSFDIRSVDKVTYNRNDVPGNLNDDIK